MLCAKKFSFIIIFTALRDLAAAERPQHCALVEFGTSSTPGKVGIGNLSVLFLSNPRPDKCENLM